MKVILARLMGSACGPWRPPVHRRDHYEAWCIIRLGAGIMMLVASMRLGAAIRMLWCIYRLGADYMRLVSSIRLGAGGTWVVPAMGWPATLWHMPCLTGLGVAPWCCKVAGVLSAWAAFI